MRRESREVCLSFRGLDFSLSLDHIGLLCEREAFARQYISFMFRFDIGGVSVLLDWFSSLVSVVCKIPKVVSWILHTSDCYIYIYMIHPLTRSHSQSLTYSLTRTFNIYTSPPLPSPLFATSKAVSIRIDGFSKYFCTAGEITRFYSILPRYHITSHYINIPPAC